MAENQTPGLTPSQKQFVGNRIIHFSDVLNSTGLYTFLKQHDAFQNGREALAAVVVGLVENNMNERFHNGLSFFERIGFLSDGKLQDHGRKVAFAKGATDFAVRGAVDIIPMIVDHVHRTREFEKLAEFVIAWMAYVNRERSIALQNRVVRLYEGNEREYDHKRFGEIFEENLSNRPGSLPPVPSSLRDHPETLFVAMLAGCDLKNGAVLERARELGDYLGFKTGQIDEQIELILDGSAAVSDLTGFAGFSVDSLFQDLIANVDQARAAAVYSVENDPFQAVRQERKKRILQGSVGLAAAAMTLATGPVGDMVMVASAPIVLKLVSSEPSANQVVEVHKRLLDLKKQVHAKAKTGDDE